MLILGLTLCFASLSIKNKYNFHKINSDIINAFYFSTKLKIIKQKEF